MSEEQAIPAYTVITIMFKDAPEETIQASNSPIEEGLTPTIVLGQLLVAGCAECVTTPKYYASTESARKSAAMQAFADLYDELKRRS